MPAESRIEMVRGAELFAAPAGEWHATLHADLAFLLRALVAPGYVAAVDMLTRTGEATEVAPDASIFPAERDPETLGRKLEELAFEITDRQRLGVPTTRARALAERGVRRIFLVRVKARTVCEWSVEKDDWEPLPAGAILDDHCLVRPLPMAALLDATLADEAILGALRAKVPALEDAFVERETQGMRQSLLLVLEGRGLRLTAADHATIDEADLETLSGWLRRAGTVASAADLLSGR